MTQNRELAPVEGEREVLSPADVKALALVTTVLDWMEATACYNFSEACRELDVPRCNLYRAFKRSCVQGMMLERYYETHIAEALIYQENWLDVMINVAAIAKGNGREAVQAARFLREVGKEAEQLTAGGEEKGESEAARLLRRWRGPVKLKQTTTVQEVTLTDSEPEPFPAEND